MHAEPMKRLLVIAGPNGSGKSSLVHDTKLSVDMDTIINPDNYARGLCDKIADPVERYKVAMNVCDSLRNRLLEEGVSFGFETVASKRDKLEFVKKAKDKGYYIDFIFVSAGTPERCYERVQERVRQGGHDVPKEKVFARYRRTMGLLWEYLEVSDHADVWDNSGDGLVLLLTKSDGGYDVTDEGNDSEWLKKYAYPLFASLFPSIWI